MMMIIRVRVMNIRNTILLLIIFFYNHLFHFHFRFFSLMKIWILWMCQIIVMLFIRFFSLYHHQLWLNDFTWYIRNDDSCIFSISSFQWVKKLIFETKKLSSFRIDCPHPHHQWLTIDHLDDWDGNLLCVWPSPPQPTNKWWKKICCSHSNDDVIINY